MKASYVCRRCKGSGKRPRNRWGIWTQINCPVCVAKGMPPKIDVVVDPIFGLASARVNTKCRGPVVQRW